MSPSSQRITIHNENAVAVVVSCLIAYFVQSVMSATRVLLIKFNKTKDVARDRGSCSLLKVLFM